MLSLETYCKPCKCQATLHNFSLQTPCFTNLSLNTWIIMITQSVHNKQNNYKSLNNQMRTKIISSQTLQYDTFKVKNLLACREDICKPMQAHGNLVEYTVCMSQHNQLEHWPTFPVWSLEHPAKRPHKKSQLHATKLVTHWKCFKSIASGQQLDWLDTSPSCKFVSIWYSSGSY
jgi:hypothetical protein